ncbi:hypothetical protein WOLCODRAFT_142154 [Wolfiporia cocos MD-104 SS10]|uniref:F-box domain-containing protein n=1 Tax=Wolfiporia cocos (strain MD-104) TaxID=742152 RepID=A0A2H3JEP6_WOLCO|nr:hypothetical protein WOLCODRAFT_142154 [Wolfiporia cocos MD-104 SS10]
MHSIARAQFESEREYTVSMEDAAFMNAVQSSPDESLDYGGRAPRTSSDCQISGAVVKRQATPVVHACNVEIRRALPFSEPTRPVLGSTTSDWTSSTTSRTPKTMLHGLCSVHGATSSRSTRSFPYRDRSYFSLRGLSITPQAIFDVIPPRSHTSSIPASAQPLPSIGLSYVNPGSLPAQKHTEPFGASLTPIRSRLILPLGPCYISRSLESSPAGLPCNFSWSFPLEVCEKIIDYAGDITISDASTYEHLSLAQSLTFRQRFRRRDLWRCLFICRALYPCAQRNMVRDVVIRRYTQLDGFVRLLTRRPYLRGFVQSLSIRPQCDFTPSEGESGRRTWATFPLVLARKLPRLRRLCIDCASQAQTSASSYWLCLRDLAYITELVLVTYPYESWGGMERAICLFPKLRILRFRGADLHATQSDTPLNPHFKRTMAITDKLHLLELTDSFFNDGQNSFGNLIRLCDSLLTIWPKDLPLESFHVRRLSASSAMPAPRRAVWSMNRLLHAAGSNLLHVQIDTTRLCAPSDNGRAFIDLSRNTNLESIVLLDFGLCDHSNASLSSGAWISSFLYGINSSVKEITLDTSVCQRYQLDDNGRRSIDEVKLLQPFEMSSCPIIDAILSRPRYRNLRTQCTVALLNSISDRKCHYLMLEESCQFALERNGTNLANGAHPQVDRFCTLYMEPDALSRA